MVKKSLRIWLDPLLLSQYKISVTEIEQKLLEENIEIPAGRLESKYRDYTVKLESGFKTEDDFRNLVIKKGQNFSFVKLGDVAKIEIGPEETRQIFRGNAEEMIGLGILKQTSANLIDVTDGVKKEFLKIKKIYQKILKYIKAMILHYSCRGVRRSNLYIMFCYNFSYNNYPCFFEKYKIYNNSILNSSDFYFIDIYFFKYIWIHY